MILKEVFLMVISTNILKILADITGEPRCDFAICQILKDAIEHRVERIERKAISIPLH